MADWGVAGREPERDETVALLTLLRAAPRGVRWSDLAKEVQFAGSAIAMLNQLRDTEASLFPDPALDQAAALAQAELTEWETAGLDLVTVLSVRYPQRLAAAFDCPPLLFAEGALVPGDRGMSVVGSRRA